MRHHLEQIGARKLMARALEIDLCKNNKSVRSAPASHFPPLATMTSTHWQTQNINTHVDRRAMSLYMYIRRYWDMCKRCCCY